MILTENNNLGTIVLKITEISLTFTEDYNLGRV